MISNAVESSMDNSVICEEKEGILPARCIINHKMLTSLLS